MNSRNLSRFHNFQEVILRKKNRNKNPTSIVSAQNRKENKEKKRKEKKIYSKLYNEPLLKDPDPD